MNIIKYTLILAALLCTGCPQPPYWGAGADCRALQWEYRSVVAGKIHKNRPIGDAWRLIEEGDDEKCVIYSDKTDQWISERLARKAINNRLNANK